MTMQFGELKDIDPREAWPNEAHDFTPWLADNLERLAQVIGIPMELEGSEVKVEQFSADILARDPTDNSLILIENQLESTDHSHLGQILTYLAGLNAQTIIWVAKDFREAHLSAIRWLNQHTADPFAFFAVQVRVVRIGDDNSSPVAPLFEVLERPSEWDRRVSASQEGREWSELARHRNDFWRVYVEQYPNDLQLRPNHIDSNVYHRMAGLVVSQYLARREVGIYLRSADSSVESTRHLEIYEAILEGRDIDRSNLHTIGGEVEVSSRKPPHYAVRNLPVDSHNRDNWPKMVEWLHEQLQEYHNVLMVEEEETLGPAAIESRPTQS